MSYWALLSGRNRTERQLVRIFSAAPSPPAAARSNPPSASTGRKTSTKEQMQGSQVAWLTADARPPAQKSIQQVESSKARHPGTVKERSSFCLPHPTLTSEKSRASAVSADMGQSCERAAERKSATPASANRRRDGRRLIDMDYLRANSCADSARIFFEEAGILHRNELFHAGWLRTYDGED